MRIKNIALSVLPNEFFSIVDAISESWPSIQLGDGGIEAILKALTIDAKDTIIIGAMADLKRMLDHARKRCVGGRLGRYEVGWKDGQRFLRLIPRSGREVTMIARSEESDFWIDIYLDFGRRGSRNQVGTLLNDIKAYEKRLKRISITSVEGTSPFGENLIDATLKML